MKVVEACLGSSVGYSTGLQCTLVVWSSLAQTMHMLPAKVAVAAHHLHVVTLPTLPSHYCRACTMGHHWIGLSTSHANGKSRHSGLDSMVWVGTNLIHDFTAVTFSVKLAFFCEKHPFPWNPWNSWNPQFFVNFNAFTFIYENFQSFINRFCADFAVCYVSHFSTK